jgi:hypothetical protein
LSSKQKNYPVRVEFKTLEITRAEMPSLFSMQFALERCYERWQKDPYGNKFFSTALATIKSDSIKCLRISDFNTQGMKYEEDAGSFYAFMKAVGVNQKSSKGSGGSFGFGKGAYYAASKIKAILVSSLFNEDNSVVFQGKTRLTTHYDLDKNRRDYVGYFGDSLGNPILNKNGIPPSFGRAIPGTDIVILGFNEEQDWKESMIKSILNNFWLAIWEGKLVVEVHDKLIDKENLENVISEYYSEADNDGSVNEPEGWNPYPYFKAIKYQDGPNSKVYTDTLPVLGRVTLNIIVKEGMPNRIAYLRSPKMIVYKKTDNRGHNYAAVFVCDNETGDTILREMENPQHNEWKKNNYLDSDKPHPNAVAAEKELRDFIRKSLEDLNAYNTSSRQKIYGLDDYLTIPEDLLPEDSEGEGGTGSGTVTQEIIKEETPVETTASMAPPVIRLTVSKKVSVSKISKVDLNFDEGILGLTSSVGEPKDKEGNQFQQREGTVPGNAATSVGKNGDEKAKVEKHIRYRVVAQKNAIGTIEHIIKIYSTEEDTSTIELLAGTDNDNDDRDNELGILTATADTGLIDVEGHTLKNVTLNKGETILRVVFDSNQKHSLKIKSYEI